MPTDMRVGVSWTGNSLVAGDPAATTAAPDLGWGWGVSGIDLALSGPLLPSSPSSPGLSSPFSLLLPFSLGVTISASVAWSLDSDLFFLWLCVSLAYPTPGSLSSGHCSSLLSLSACLFLALLFP